MKGIRRQVGIAISKVISYYISLRSFRQVSRSSGNLITSDTLVDRLNNTLLLLPWLLLNYFYEMIILLNIHEILKPTQRSLMMRPTLKSRTYLPTLRVILRDALWNWTMESMEQQFFSRHFRVLMAMKITSTYLLITGVSDLSALPCIGSPTLQLL